MVTDPATRTARAGRMFLALFVITAFSLFWDSGTVDMVALGLNAAMWFLMVVEARREFARLTTTDRPDDRL